MVPRNEPTVTSTSLDKDESWNYYIQTYMMCSPTEGIPHERCKKAFLRRNYPKIKDVDVLAQKHTYVKEAIEVRICVNTYKIFFMSGTEDIVVKDPRVWAKVTDGQRERRKEKWRGVLAGLGWQKDASEDEKATRLKEYDDLIKAGSSAEVEMKDA